MATGIPSNNYKLLFWLFLTGTTILADVQLVQNKQLKNETASAGIISLETGKNFSRDTGIVNSWKAQLRDSMRTDLCSNTQPVSHLPVARLNVYIDFIFIVFYTLLALVVISWIEARSLKKHPAFTRVVLMLAIIAGCMDVIEDLGMLQFISHAIDGRLTQMNRSIVYLTFIPAYIKFSLLALIAFVYLPYKLLLHEEGLQTISCFISKRLEQLFRYRVIILGAVIFALPLWKLDQGQDLLVNITQKSTGVVLFISIVVVAAFLNWYFTKLFFQKE